MNAEYFHTLTDAARHLNWKEDEAVLQQMQSVYENKEYIVAFIGHYSAGKSRLINNLLGKELLPRGIMETTPVLTYIHYGEEELARICYQDATTEQILIEQIPELIQGKMNTEWDLNTIEYLEVVLPNELLRQGMILMDTPGFNTLIERHEQLLFYSLNKASQVVYVAGNAPSQVDVGKIQLLQDREISVTFVRTHCDAINPNEESDEEVIRRDCEVLQELGIDSEDCIHLSNLEDSRWFTGVSELRKRLSYIDGELESQLELQTAKQLSAIARRCLDALKTELDEIEEICREDENGIDQKKAELEKQISRLEMYCQEADNKLQRQLREVCSMIDSTIRNELNEELDGSVRYIERHDAEFTDENDIMRYASRQAIKFAERAEAVLEEKFGSIFREIDSSLVKMTADLTLPEVGTTQSDITEQDAEMQQMQAESQQLEQKLEEAAQSYEAKEIDERAVTVRYSESMADLETLQAENANKVNEHIPEEIKHTGLQPSNIAYAVGKVADFAMFVLTGTQMAGVASKGAEFLLKNNAVANNAVQSIVKKTLPAMDMVKDTSFLGGVLARPFRKRKQQCIEKQYQEQVSRKTNEYIEGVSSRVSQKIQEPDYDSPADVLSIGYWAQKIFKRFDHPAIWVDDEEYQKKYREEKQKIEQQILEEQRKAYELKCQCQVYRTEKERAEAQRKSLEIDKQEMQRRLAEREKYLRKAAQKLQMENWRKQCAQQYQSQMSQEIDSYIRILLEEVPKKLAEYQGQKTALLRSQMQHKKEQLDALANASDSERMKQRDDLLALSKKVEECVQ